MILRANSSDASGRHRFKGQLGFTFIEIVVAVSILGLMAAGSIWTLTQMNNYASVTRLYTGAETVAQNRIDEILSESPFKPQEGDVPKVLALTTADSCAHSDTGHGPGCVEIYHEPDKEGEPPGVVYGKLTTSVKEVTDTKVAGAVTNLHIYSATAVVSYVFRGKTYRVQLNAMRAPDV